MEVTGPVSATIYFSTDVPDTDITVKLLDVQPDGRALNISHGIARARYHESFSKPATLKFGVTYELRVRMYPTSNTFFRGHRIRVEVSSSNFPLFGRNLNTGESSDTSTEMRVAKTRVHHDAQSPSRLTLPVIPLTVRPSSGSP
jgi:putative CocE/NonD family hydrolase